MAAGPFVDLTQIDLEQEVLGVPLIREYLPQRDEFTLIDGVCYIDRDAALMVAWKDFNEEDWWAKAHFPGNPLVPGVLMVEGAAQVATVLWKEIDTLDHAVIGFGGLENVRFRGQVRPPARMYFVAKDGPRRSRLARFLTQAFVDGKMVFEGTILGVAI